MGAEKKLRIYLDSSVVNHLFADDTPNRMRDTIRLWEECGAGKYDVFVSPVVLYEIGKCKEPKRSQMLEKMNLIEFENLEETDEVNELAAEYIKHGVLTEKSLNDCLHIAYAVVNNCDVVVSWNFKHLVRFKTNDKVKIVNAINRYRGGNCKNPFLSASSISPSAPVSRPASFWHSLSTPLKLQNWRFATGSEILSLYRLQCSLMTRRKNEAQ
jgi:predicted nucleic acid-binding protein